MLAYPYPQRLLPLLACLAAPGCLSFGSGDVTDIEGREDLRECAGDLSQDEIDLNLQISADYAQSLHEMVACGGLAVRLCQGVSSGIIDALLTNSSDATPDGWTYQGEGVYRTGNAGTDMTTRFYVTEDYSFAAAGEVVMATLPVLGGVAIVENGHHQPALIEALTADDLWTREPELLQEAWTHLPTIPLAPLDLLVLRAIGKDISGTGMDLNVVGMWRRSGGPVEPAIARLAVLDLTPNSHGNGIGVGYADVIPQALRDKIDWPATYTNCLTSANFNGAKVPITLPDVHSTIVTALPSLEPADARMVIARNTLDLEELWVSQALLTDVARAPQLEQIGDLRPLRFDAHGNLQL